MNSRESAVAEALGSLRLEGLEPEPEVVELLARWAQGEITDAEFESAQKVIDAHGTLTKLPPAGLAS